MRSKQDGPGVPKRGAGISSGSPTPPTRPTAHDRLARDPPTRRSVRDFHPPRNGVGGPSWRAKPLWPATTTTGTRLLPPRACFPRTAVGHDRAAARGRTWCARESPSLQVPKGCGLARPWVLQQECPLRLLSALLECDTHEAALATGVGQPHLRMGIAKRKRTRSSRKDRPATLFVDCEPAEYVNLGVKPLSMSILAVAEYVNAGGWSMSMRWPSMSMRGPSMSICS